MVLVRSLFLLLALLVASMAVSQPEDPQLRKEIEAFYAKWDKLVGANNVKGLIDMIDPSFVQVDPDGKKMTYAEMRGQMMAMLDSVREPKSKITLERVYAQGDETVAWVTMVSSFKMQAGKKWKPMSFTMKFAETIKRTPKGLKFVFSQALP